LLPYNVSPLLPEIHVTSHSPDVEKDTKQPADGPPIDVSRPIGDALPTPVEPGLDQPLPEKPADEPEEKEKNKGNASTGSLGDTDTPPGVPELGPSDFA
jgi:hypothetical protein